MGERVEAARVARDHEVGAWGKTRLAPLLLGLHRGVHQDYAVPLTQRLLKRAQLAG